MKIIILIILQSSLIYNSWSQELRREKKNFIFLNQSLFDVGGKEINLSVKSNTLGYKIFNKKMGFGIELNRLQMLKNSLKPIGPTDCIYRRDNLYLLYSSFPVSYSFTEFCLLKNLIFSIDIAPSFLIGGKNKYYFSNTNINNYNLFNLSRIPPLTKF